MKLRIADRPTAGQGTALSIGKLAWLVFVLALAGTPAVGTAQVNIFLKPGSGQRSPVRGEISEMGPDQISVKTEAGVVQVDVINLRNIVYSAPPSEIAKANNRFEAMQFDEGLEELAKLEGKVNGRDLEHEVAYLRALGSAESALNGGKVTAQEAGQVVTVFFRSFPQSFYTWPLTERLGKLLTAIGRNDLAQKEFEKLAGSASPDFKLKGAFFVAVAQLAAGDAAAAGKNLKDVVDSSLDTPEIRELKSRARALQLRAMALGGQRNEARAAAEALIVSENPENSALFSEIYNTIGLCHYEDGNMEAAVIAFLHTDLLFFNQPDAHAEALWYLSQIWPKLNKPDAGFEAQENLRRLYRNSPWAAKLPK